MFRLNRNAFKIQTHEESSNTRSYWLSKSPQERLEAAWYLICTAYNIDIKNPPRLDRTVFSMRKNG
jgi:uncharacterized protein (UPF0262 family)